MADDSSIHDPDPRSSTEDTETRTFLGGTRLGTRTASFFVFGLLAIAGAGGLLYQADRLTNTALDRTTASQQVHGLVTRIEAGVLHLQSDERNFLLEKEMRFAADFDKRVQPVLADIEHLYNHPAAKTVTNHISTVNDGVAQLSSQFERIVGIQRIVGLKDGDGLVNMVWDTAAGVEDRLTALNATGLIQDFSTLRNLEARLVAAQGAVSAEQIDSKLNAFKNKVSTSALPQTDVGPVRSLVDAYGKDFTQLASANQTLTTEIGRLEEINSYMMPSLDALVAFAKDILSEAQTAQNRTRDTVRLMLGGGMGGIVLVLTLIGLMLISSVTRPTARLAHAATRLAHGDGRTTIPALGNDDETGAIAKALTYFRENINQADRLRKELETSLAKAATPAAAPSQPTPEARAPALPAERSAADSQITEISRLVTQTSENASIAAKEAERTSTVIKGLEKAGHALDEAAHLMSDIRDQAGLLATQAAMMGARNATPEIDHHETDDENLIVLPTKLRGGDRKGPSPLMSPEERIEDIQNRSQKAGDLMREITRSLDTVSSVAKDLAAETSSHALQAATQLARQSEDLRSMIDGLVEKVRPSEPDTPQSDQDDK